MLAGSALVVLQVVLALSDASERGPRPVQEPVVARNVAVNERTATDAVIFDPVMVELAKNMWEKDSNKANVYMQLQAKLTGAAAKKGDGSSQMLLQDIPSAVLSKPTYSAFMSLLDNYYRDTSLREIETDAEKKEIQHFLDLVTQTDVMKLLFQTLVKKGLVANSQSAFRDLLHKLWFVNYPRHRNIPGSSGFEHVFVGELNRGAVMGLHNWLQFHLLEKSGEVNYYGYMYSVPLGGGPGLIKYRFSMSDTVKPVTSMFVGTSPEFEMALYTACFLLVEENKCAVRIGDKNINVRTHKYTRGGNTYIGTAFPELGARD